MSRENTQLRIINVVDPIMCLRCSSAHIAEVLFTDGSTKKMFYCSRLDCDNWNCSGSEVSEVEEAATEELGE
ncbi:MAG: hypothetical protein KBC96_03090 [Armatimonadetes bacterium]|nr:hypothetical protein [Armatimonadota bacterium]